MTLEELLASLEDDKAKVIMDTLETTKINIKKEFETKLAEKDKSINELKSQFEELKKQSEQKQDDNNEKESLAVKELQQKLEDMQNQLAQKEKEAVNATITNELNSAFNGKFKGTNLMIKELIANGEAVLENGKVFIKQNDKVVSLDDGVKLLQEDNRFKDLAVIEQKGGTGEGVPQGGEPQLGIDLNADADSILDNLGLMF